MDSFKAIKALNSNVNNCKRSVAGPHVINDEKAKKSSIKGMSLYEI